VSNMSLERCPLARDRMLPSAGEMRWRSCMGASHR
jgi:hypothetical protein